MTGLALACGTWDDARAMIGPPLLRLQGVDPVEAGAIRRLLEVHEWDLPPAYDRDAARQAGYRDVVAPATSYLSFALPPYWSPGDPPLPAHVIPPLPYRHVPGEGSMMIATSVSVRLGEPLHPGDVVSSTWWLRSVTPKTTRLGAGAFLTFEARFATQRGDEVAREHTTVLRYEPSKSDAGARPDRSPPAVVSGAAVVATTSIDLTLQRLVMAAGANRDFAPVHHDPAVAAAAGLGAPFANSMFVATQFERTVVEWAGPWWRPATVEVQLVAPAAAGSAFVVSGTAAERPHPGGALVTCRLEGRTVDGLATRGSVSGSGPRTPPPTQ